MKLFCAILAGLLLCATGCAGKVQLGEVEVAAEPTTTAMPEASPIVTSAPQPGAVTVPAVSSAPAVGNLMCYAETLEEAQRIAALYGITFVTYTAPIALFDTDEDVRSVIARGMQNGWPELSVNGKVYEFSD